MTAHLVPESWVEQANLIRRQFGSYIGMWNAIIAGEPIEVIVIGENDQPLLTLPAGEPVSVENLIIVWEAVLRPGMIQEPVRTYGLIYGTATNKRRIRWTDNGVPYYMTIPVNARWTFTVTCNVAFAAKLEVAYEFVEDGVLLPIVVRRTLQPGEPV